MGSPTDWKVTGSQRFTYRSESPELHIRLPCVGIWHWKKDPPGASGIEGQWGLCAGAPQDWGKWRPHSQKVHTDFHVHWVPGQSRGSIGIWVKPDCSSWRILWESRGECGLLWGKDIGSKALGNIQQHAFLWRWPFWENLAPPIRSC